MIYCPQQPVYAIIRLKPHEFPAVGCRAEGLLMLVHLNLNFINYYEKVIAARLIMQLDSSFEADFIREALFNIENHMKETRERFLLEDIYRMFGEKFDA